MTAPRVPTTDAERYRALVEQAVDGIFVTNDEGVYLEVNASGARLLGRTRDEIVGHSVNDFLDDASRVQLADDWVILRRGDAVTRERTFRRGDGSTFPGEVTAKRLSDGTYQGILRDISVRRKAEETLRRNEEHLRHLTAASLEGICIQQNGVIVETNAQFAAMLGYGYDELVGCEVLSLMAPESMALMTEVVRGRLDGIFEQVLLRKDGSRIVVESQAKNVRWDDRPLRIVAVRDISERKRTELALRTSEEKFSKIFRVSPISIILSDIAIGRIIDVNDAFLRTYVCKREAVVGRTTLELGLWQDPAERAHLISVVAREGTAHNFRIRGRTVPGTPITVLVNCELLEFSGQTCILTMVQDITEQERAEEALRESEDKFSRAFRSGPSALAISEFETGRYIEVNEGFTRLYGYTREEAVGRTSVELGIMRSTAERAELMRNFTSGGTIRELELQTVNRRGETIHYLLNAEVMMLRGRRCIVLAAQDITERVRAEAERAGRAVAEMRAHEEFTRRLLDAQEAERRRIAGELHDSLGQNLILLKNRARLALDSGTIPAEFHWQFETIEKMANDAIAEVRQISRDLHPYQLDQLGLTRALENLILGVEASTGFPFAQRIEDIDDLFPREAAAHFFRIVQESVNNILKHARARSARIRVERDVHEVLLEIKDDGCGFGEATGGLGLKNITERVRILGGTLRIDSGPGRGTRIEVSIPFLPAAGEPANADPASGNRDVPPRVGRQAG